MTNLLTRLFVRGGDPTEPAVREAYGKLVGVVGIVSNLLLFAGKMLAGLLSGSLAIMADAVNNLSDSVSSVVTLIGFKLSAMPPDEKHPYGHARYEYISGLLVSVLIITIGIEFFKSSLEKILHPEPIMLTTLTVVILVVSIAVKLWQGLFNRNIGHRIQSDALRATAADSINDVISTTAVLIGALVCHFTDLMLDGWLGLAVAVFILVSGIKLVLDTLNPLIGMAPDEEQADQLKEKIMAYPSVLGIHDLIVHNYGPGHFFASVHVEVPACQNILISHEIADDIEREIQLELGIELVVHLDPIVTDDEQLNTMRSRVCALINAFDSSLSMHDFRMVEGTNHTNLIFDVVVPPRYALDDNILREKLLELVRENIDETMYCVITVDRSYTTTRPKLGRH